MMPHKRIYKLYVPLLAALFLLCNYFFNLEYLLYNMYNIYDVYYAHRILKSNDI